MSTPEKARAAGLVGAGGAGFPTHVKLDSQVEVVIANGAECEPLLGCDQALMASRPEALIRGLELAMETTGAREGWIAVKAKHAGLLQVLEGALGERKDIRLARMDDTYPAGDEHVTVLEVTGRRVPAGGLPLQVGCLVQNVATLAWLADAVDHGQPVTRRLVTVCGAVAEPVTLEVPVGTPIRELLPAAGAITIDDPAYLLGGILMGDLTEDLDQPVTKTLSAVVILPDSNPAVLERRASIPRMAQLTRYCVNCRQCTDTCPRYLLGQPVEPHKAMRALTFGDPAVRSDFNPFYCCECGLCSLFGCFMYLSPRRVYQELKARSRDRSFPPPPEPVPLEQRSYRRVPTSLIKRRLALGRYDRPAPLRTEPIRPERVWIPLIQHIGAPAEPVVAPGDRVQVGQLVGEIPAGQLGARVHASIDGRVERVGQTVEIRADGGDR